MRCGATISTRASPACSTPSLRPCPSSRGRSPHAPGRYDRRVPDRLYLTESDEANALIASDPMALLVGLALDQQVTVQQAFLGPLGLRDRLGAIEPVTLATAALAPAS